MELQKQADELRKKGIKLIKEGKIEEGRELLLMAARKYRLAAEFSDGVAKSVRLELAEECERLAKAESSRERRKVEKEKKEVKRKSEFEDYIKNLMISREEKEKLPSWDDIGGLEEVKEKLMTCLVLTLIENKPKAIKGDNILLYGPPGTGKTLLAAAVARNLDANFFDVKISDLMSKYYGETSKILSALFRVAESNPPSIIFIDEIDSIALRREGELDEETRRVQSTFLAELDGLKKKGKDRSRPVIVIGATNLIDKLDPAFTRPDRFGIKIEVPLPDYEACREIIKIHTVRGGIDIDNELVDELAKICAERKMSGAEIKGICMDAIWRMVVEMNPDLKKLAGEPYEKIRNYRLRIRKLKREDFGI